MKKQQILLATYLPIILSSFATSSLAKKPSNELILDTVTVIGTEDRRKEIAGSASIVSKEKLEKHQYTDVNRALKEVTGVQIQEEEGYGLRPNIAIRGGRSSRSADITLMEDGILAAPAPYAAPSAYYFPNMDRMESIEVIKGSGSVKYGPRTTNGILNLVTKAIPLENSTKIIAEGGSNKTYRYGVTTGTGTDNIGLMLNAFNRETEGFKKTDFTTEDTGYETKDILGKVRLVSDKDFYQEFELKFGTYDEVSNETYLGLTDSDFNNNPNRRYGASQLDEMNVRANQVALNHLFEINPDMVVNTTIYNRAMERSWYKLESVRIGGVSRTIGQIFSNQSANQTYIDAIKSGNTTGGTFGIRDGAREYLSRGIQSSLAYNYNISDVANKLEFGVRLHKDEEDRFQRDDRFDIVNGVATITSTGAAGSGGNQISSAKAISTFLNNEISWNKWVVAPGVRFEKINLKSQNFGTTDPNRLGTNLVAFENEINVLIPGVGVTYQLNDEISLIGGVHKGFAPPSVPNSSTSASFTDEEKSINYELGTRFQKHNWQGEVFAFITDYENLLGRDTAASGGSSAGDAFNGGKVKVSGLETVLQYDVAQILGFSKAYNIPLSATYTYTNAKFQSNFVSSFEEWGTVQKGFELPYIAQDQIYLAAEFNADKWGFSLGAKYTSEMRSIAGKGAIPVENLIESHWVFDAAAEYDVTKNVTAYTKVENLLDETYMASRRPSGARPGLPFSVMFGVKLEF